MKIYIILREDHGYLGYGPEIGAGTDIESVHVSLNDAEKHLVEKYENLYKVPVDEMYWEDPVKCIYRYFDEETEHAFEFPIYESATLIMRRVESLGYARRGLNGLDHINRSIVDRPGWHCTMYVVN